MIGLNDAELLKLNIGGISFRLRISTIRRRSLLNINARLYRLCQLTADERKKAADAYLPTSDELFFERSPLLFNFIYQYYVNGYIHQLFDVECTHDLIDELEYWHIPVDDAFNDSIRCGCANRILLLLMRNSSRVEKLAIIEQIESATIIVDDDDDVEMRRITETNTTNQDKDPFKKLCCGRLRKCVWDLVEVPDSSRYAQIFAVFSIFFVLASIAGLVIGSMPEFQVEVGGGGDVDGLFIDDNHNSTGNITMEPHQVFAHLERVCIAWFIGEYSAKMLASADRRRTFVNILNLIDVIAIVPFVFELTLQLAGINNDNIKDLRGALLVVRILRVLRVVRVFKLSRYSSGMQLFGRTLRASMRQLGMVSMVVMTGVVFFSTLLYFLEKDEPNTQFISIPSAFWWCIVTMSTVGYGDMLPTTTAGKLVASACIACGVLVLALPITIIVDNFMKVSDDNGDNTADAAVVQHPPNKSKNGAEDNDDHQSIRSTAKNNFSGLRNIGKTIASRKALVALAELKRVNSSAI